MTRIEGPIEDVTQFLANHSGPKGTSISEEVMRLLIGSPSKVGGNPSFEDCPSKKCTRNSENGGMCY
jgi:hypothetical protein